MLIKLNFYFFFPFRMKLKIKLKHGNEIKRRKSTICLVTLALTSLKLKMSVVNVELPTDGLFFTDGNIMPPFRDVALFALTLNALVGIVFDCTVFCALLAVGDAVWFVDCDVCVTTDAVVVV